MAYDVSSAFKRIENELIDSMIRNLKRHRVEELKEGLNWEQWQVLQLKELEKYRLENPKKFAKDFDSINKRVEDIFHNTYNDASTKEEARILDMIRKGKIKDVPDGAIEGTFFGLNASRLEHLVQATQADFVRGEWSVLRQANDKYRKIIFDAQAYSATGATYAQAVDMATKDFLKAGIQSITYKNGARHDIANYAEMALRTGQKRAYLMGEGDVHDKYGIHTVRVNKRANACPLCVKWLGKVLIDDVYANGTAEEAQKLGVPLLSQAIDEGFLHPNCKDVYSMYVEGISLPAEPWTKEEMQEIADNYNVEQELKRAEDMQASYDRMARNSLDPENQQRYQARADAWQNRIDVLNAGGSLAPIVPAGAPSAPKQAVNTFTPATTIQEAEDFAVSMGVNANYKGLDISMANEMNEAVQRAIDYSPKVKDKLHMIGSGQATNKMFRADVKNWALGQGYPEQYAKRMASRSVGRISSNTYAFARPGYGGSLAQIVDRYVGIFFNDVWTHDKMTQALQRDVRTKWHPAGCDTVKSVVDHELGHILDYAFDLSHNKEIGDLFRHATKQEIADGLSRYATTNIREFIAEGYTEYINNPSPRDFARKIGEIIEREAKK